MKARMMEEQWKYSHYVIKEESEKDQVVEGLIKGKQAGRVLWHSMNLKDSKIFREKERVDSPSSERRMVGRGDGKKARYLQSTWFTTSCEPGAKA